MHNNCLYCGTPFRAKRATKKYCSDNCKQLAYFKRNGLVFGMNGTKQVFPDNVKNIIVKPVVNDNINRTTVKPDAVKQAVNVKTVMPINVKQEPETLRQVNNQPSPLLNEKQLQELIYRISASLDVKIQKAIDNVKQELDVKYSSFYDKSLYGKQHIAQNTQEQVPLCSRSPVMGITKYTSEIDVKRDSSINVKSALKDETTTITQNTIMEDQQDFTLNDNGKELPKTLQYVEHTDKSEEDYPDEDAENELFGFEEEQQGSENEESELDDLNENDNTEQEEKTQKVSRQEQSQETEPEYEWIESLFLKDVENDFGKSNGGMEFRNSRNPNVNWVNIHLRCLIENIIRLTEFAAIDGETLFKITEAFNRLVSSRSFNDLPENYPYLKITAELAEWINGMAIKYQDTDHVLLRLPFKIKAKIVSVRHQMRDCIQKIKFSEMNFTEAHNMDWTEHRLAAIEQEPTDQQNRKSGLDWKDRYKEYVEAGLIEPDDEEEEGKDDEKNDKKRENPNNERIRHFQKTGKFPKVAA